MKLRLVILAELEAVRGHVVKRKALWAICREVVGGGKDDKPMRDEIAAIVNARIAPIISPPGGGYMLPRTHAEIQAAAATLKSYETKVALRRRRLLECAQATRPLFPSPPQGEGRKEQTWGRESNRSEGGPARAAD